MGEIPSEFQTLHSVRTRLAHLKPSIMMILMRRLFRRSTVYRDELHVGRMSRFTSQHMTSKVLRQALDAKSKSVLKAVACGTQAFEVLWELVLMGHGPTIRPLIWALLMGDCVGIPESMGAAVHLTKMFPDAATPGTRYMLSHECDNSIVCDWPSVIHACNSGCPQSLFIYYDSCKRPENSDNDEPEIIRRDRAAVRCLIMAANLGLAHAQYCLAQKLWWKTRNFQMCHALVVKAAEQGHESAIFLLGHRQIAESILPFPQC
jgi:hypothetical protein